MTRQIFRVDAWVIDANGTYNGMSGYPKNFDSNNYDNDIDKARRRAEGDFATVKASMCTQDTRKLQVVTLCTIDGFQLDKWSFDNGFYT